VGLMIGKTRLLTLFENGNKTPLYVLDCLRKTIKNDLIMFKIKTLEPCGLSKILKAFTVITQLATHLNQPSGQGLHILGLPRICCADWVN